MRWFHWNRCLTWSSSAHHLNGPHLASQAVVCTIWRINLNTRLFQLPETSIHHLYLLFWFLGSVFNFSGCFKSKLKLPSLFALFVLTNWDFGEKVIFDKLLTPLVVDQCELFRNHMTPVTPCVLEITMKETFLLFFCLFHFILHGAAILHLKWWNRPSLM